MQKIKTARPIVTAFVAILVAYQNKVAPTCPDILIGDKEKYSKLRRVFVHHQMKLGNNAFPAGYISYKWSLIQSLYVNTMKKSNSTFDVHWSAQVVKIIWDFSSKIWQKRCQHVHAKNPQFNSSLNDEELKVCLRTYLRHPREELSHIEKRLHLNVSANMVRASTCTLARWLHLLAEERAKTLRLKRTQQIRKGGIRPITGYFRRIASSRVEN